MKAYITLRQLVDADACRMAEDLFRLEFGDRTEVTIKKAREYAMQFDFGFCMRFLDEGVRREEFWKQKQKLWKTYGNRKGRIYRWYEKNTNLETRWVDWNDKMNTNQAWLRFEMAAAWARLYIAQEKEKAL